MQVRYEWNQMNDDLLQVSNIASERAESFVIGKLVGKSTGSVPSLNLIFPVEVLDTIS